MTFNPLSGSTKTEILNKLYGFLSTYNFISGSSTYNYNNHTLNSYIKNHVQLNTTVKGTVKVSGDYGSTIQGTATLTKTSIT